MASPPGWVLVLSLEVGLGETPAGERGAGDWRLPTNREQPWEGESLQQFLCLPREGSCVLRRPCGSLHHCRGPGLPELEKGIPRGLLALAQHTAFGKPELAKGSTVPCESQGAQLLCPHCACLVARPHLIVLFFLLG